MKLWKTVGEFLLGTPKVMDDVFDKDEGILVKTGSFINSLSYTDAEKAKNLIVLAKDAMAFTKSTLPESTVRSKTRRDLAMLWIRVQLWLVLFVAITIPFSTEKAKEFFQLATCNIMVLGTTSVIIFFFGAYALGTYVKGPPKPKE